MTPTTHEQASQDSVRGHRGFWLAVLAALVFVAAMWLGTRWLIPGIVGPPAGTDIADVADMYEIVNALFSGLAFVGVVAAILLQRRELGLQREELAETRKELAGQKKALISQNKLLRNSNNQQVLTTLLLEYRSRPMYEAVSALWQFRRTYPTETDLADAFAALPNDDPLHYHRRLVSQFYGLVAGLYSASLVPDTLLYSYWSRRDLEIIPQVILPIERVLRLKISGPDAERGQWEDKLKKLYDDAPES
jgi:hypothetical protein